MSREQKANTVRNAIIKLVKTESSLSANEIRIILSIERIVARLTSDPKLDKNLIFKGGFVLLKSLDSNRFTRDLDALGLDIDKDQIEELVPQALAFDLNDGFWFGDVKTESLDEQGEYGALRFNCAYQIGDPPTKKDGFKKLSRIHFDVGFGDAISSGLKRTMMPTLLTYETQTSWRVYPPEFIFSEKLQTFVKRSDTNSRSKDIYDMGILFDKCNPKKLIIAIKDTFERRSTEIPHSFVELANALDTNMLEHSWSSVKFMSEESTFDEAWNLLLRRLKNIDVALLK